MKVTDGQTGTGYNHTAVNCAQLCVSSWCVAGFIRCDVSLIGLLNSYMAEGFSACPFHTLPLLSSALIPVPFRFSPTYASQSRARCRFCYTTRGNVCTCINCDKVMSDGASSTDTTLSLYSSCSWRTTFVRIIVSFRFFKFWIKLLRLP